MSVQNVPQEKNRIGIQDKYILGLSHISVRVRDVDEAAAFWIDLFEAEPYHRRPNGQVFEIRLSGVVLAFFDAPGVIGTKVAYPHYAFIASPEGMRVLKKRLDDAGVKTHPIWTRDYIKALMYFRDPSGNMFELYCPKYDRPDELRLAKARNGDFEPPIEDMMYDWPKG